MKAALDDAAMHPSEVDYVNVHGTSTPLGDIAETKAIQGVFGDHAYDLNISSTKSMTGHLLGAAGAIEGIACILAIKNGIIPPTINFEHSDDQLDQKLDFTFNTAKKRNVRAAFRIHSDSEATMLPFCFANLYNGFFQWGCSIRRGCGD